MNENKSGAGGIIAIIVVVVLLIAMVGSCSGSGSSGGDGKSTCRNCGRKKPLVAGYGYCSTCYEGFRDWQKNNGYD